MNSFLETPTGEIVNLANVFNISIRSSYREYHVEASGLGCEGDEDMVCQQSAVLYDGGKDKTKAEAYLAWLKKELVAPRTFISNTFVEPTDAPVTEAPND